MKTSLQITSALMVLAFLAHSAMAWDGYGHMAVASVAYRKLDAKTRARADQLLMLNPYFKDKWPALIPSGTSDADRTRLIFMLAATWPDAIKQDNSYHNDGSNNGDSPDGPNASQNTGYDDFNRHKYWHFVDTPFSQAGTDVSKMKVPVPDAQTQIAAFRAVLKSNSPDPLKSYDLVWLLHIVGDVHQPLHCSTRVSQAFPKGDTGGNDVPFCTAKAGKCDSNLHAFWDDILGSGDSVTAPDKFAAGLVAPTVTAADIADATKWIGASFMLAQSSVYVDPPVDKGAPPFRATTKYTTDAKALAKKQVALAGARLAKILQSELK